MSKIKNHIDIAKSEITNQNTIDDPLLNAINIFIGDMEKAKIEANNATGSVKKTFFSTFSPQELTNFAKQADKCIEDVYSSLKSAGVKLPLVTVMMTTPGTADPSTYYPGGKLK